MFPLLLAILLASLLGNLHCAGMCGAFVAFALRLNDPERRGSRGALMAAYNGGRLITYSALGAVAGIVGSALDAAGTFAGVGHAAALLAGALMVVSASITLLRLAGHRIKTVPVPAFMRRALESGHRGAAGLPPLGQALLTGLLTTLLPCGWLYAFVTVAAGTANLWMGALVMAVFWLGTLPVLVSLGLALGKFGGPLAKRLPTITALLVLLAGLHTLVTRLHALPFSAPVANAASVEHLQSIEHATPPCCVPATECK